MWDASFQERPIDQSLRGAIGGHGFIGRPHVSAHMRSTQAEQANMEAAGRQELIQASADKSRGGNAAPVINHCRCSEDVFNDSTPVPSCSLCSAP